MKRLDIDQLIAGIGSLRFLVVGDLMLDEYLWGAADRISPEAPVQVIDVRREDLRLGGAGNVLNNLADIGAQVQVVSVLGDDEDGERINAILSRKGIDTSGILQAENRKTSRKTRVLASNQQILRIDRETTTPIDAALEQRVIDHVTSVVQDFDAILLSDYQKGVLTDSVLKEIIRIGREKGLPVLVDPKGSDFTKYRGATLLTPNRKEAQLAAGCSITDKPSLLEAGHRLRSELELDALVLTRSEEGMSIFKADGSELHLPTQAREVFDVSGAGDTVLSYLGIGLAHGLCLEEAGKLANMAAGIVVAKVGTSTVRADELRAASGASLGFDRKIKDRHALKDVLHSTAMRDKAVVFTNGCFDLLHVGHVKYLQKARQLGDLLVLGLNSDDSIRRLKGPRRPLIGEEERAHILAALDCIDYVVLFDEDTPLELISLLKPTVLVKGGDYTPEGVVGKDIVESYGGRVELIQFVDGKSTTNIIEKIMAQYREE